MGKPTFWLISGGASIKTLIGYGIGPFLASNFLRNHPQQVAELARTVGGALHLALGSVGILGLSIGVCTFLPGAFGAYFGGWITDRLGSRDTRDHLIAPAVAALLQIPLFIGAVCTDRIGLAMALLGAYGFCQATWQGPVYATAQSIVPPTMRATTAAVVIFMVNILSQALGPLIAGALSDFYAGPMGMGSGRGLRWSLISVASVSVFASLLFWLGRRTIRQDTVS